MVLLYTRLRSPRMRETGFDPGDAEHTTPRHLVSSRCSRGRMLVDASTLMLPIQPVASPLASPAVRAAPGAVVRRRPMGAVGPLMGCWLCDEGLSDLRNSAVFPDFETLSIRSLSCETRSVRCSVRLGSLEWRIWSCLSRSRPCAHSSWYGVGLRDSLSQTSPLCSTNSARHRLIFGGT